MHDKPTNYRDAYHAKCEEVLGLQDAFELLRTAHAELEEERDIWRDLAKERGDELADIARGLGEISETLAKLTPILEDDPE